MTPWTVAHQAPLFLEFSRQEYRSGLPCPSPVDLCNPGIEPRSCALQADSLPSEPPGKPSNILQFSSVAQSCLTLGDHSNVARQASLSIPNSRSLLKLMSIVLVIPSNHLILLVVPFPSCLQSFPASRFFQMSQFFSSGDQSIGVLASASVLPMNG